MVPIHRKRPLSARPATKNIQQSGQTSPKRSQALPSATSTRIAKHLGTALRTGAGSDLTVYFQGQSYAVHSFVLASCPPFLRRLSNEEMENTDISPRLFEVMLHFIYTEEIMWSECNTLQDFVDLHRFAASSGVTDFWPCVNSEANKQMLAGVASEMESPKHVIYRHLPSLAPFGDMARQLHQRPRPHHPHDDPSEESHAWFEIVANVGDRIAALAGPHPVELFEPFIAPVVDALIEVLSVKARSYVKEGAIYSISQLGLCATRAIPSLADCLDSDRGDVAYNARVALRQIIKLRPLLLPQTLLRLPVQFISDDDVLSLFPIKVVQWGEEEYECEHPGCGFYHHVKGFVEQHEKTCVHKGDSYDEGSAGNAESEDDEGEDLHGPIISAHVEVLLVLDKVTR